MVTLDEKAYVSFHMDHFPRFGMEGQNFMNE